MKSFIAATFIAAAAAATEAGAAKAIRFTGLASGPSGTSLNAGVINANHGSFWVGKDTLTSVPKGTDPASVNGQSNTKNEHTTIFNFINGQGTVNLDVIVPNGQVVYVNKADGKLRFTAAGAAGKGAVLTKGFSKTSDGTLKFEGKGWYGCGDDKAGYEIVAESRIPTVRDGCRGFTWQVQKIPSVFDGGRSRAYEYD